jgi:glycosyltransferase involved in cell wall biosynthesis
LTPSESRTQAADTGPDQPLATIGVPVYNGERYLAQCLDSLLAQTYRDFTLLISDNASTDGTAEICRRYVAADSRVHYHRNEVNIGLYANFRFILDAVRTRYVKMASADDYWAPAMLGDALAQMERDASLVLCYPQAVLVDQNGAEQSKYDHRLQLMEDDPAMRFTRALTEVGLVNQLQGLIRIDAVRAALPLLDLPGSDNVFLAELSLHGKIMQLPAYQYYRRFHEEASSWNRASGDHQIKRVLKAGSRQMRLVNWKLHAGLMRRLLHSPLKSAAKLKLLLFLVKRMVWDRTTLLHELWQLLRPANTAQQ